MEGNNMTEVTLKDGKTFNSRFHDIMTALEDINGYLFCEYNEHISIDDISNIKTSSDKDVCNWLASKHSVYAVNINVVIEKERT
jgi:hypothetical protein